MSKARRATPASASTGRLAQQALQHYAQELRRYLQRRVGRPQDVDDLAQEVYLRLLRWGDEKVIEKPLQYLYGIAAHVIADFRMAVSRSPAAFSDVELTDLAECPADDATDAMHESLDIERRLTEALGKLPATYAAIVIGFHHEGLTYEEIGARLNLSAHTVHKYLTRARAQLRLLLGEDE